MQSLLSMTTPASVALLAEPNANEISAEDPESFMNDEEISESPTLESGQAPETGPISLPSRILSDVDFDSVLKHPGVIVLDVFPAWSGSCEILTTTVLRRLLNESEDTLFCLHAVSDQVHALEPFRNKSIPTFLIYRDGILTAVIRGSNGPLVEQTVRQELDAMKRQVAPVEWSGFHAAQATTDIEVDEDSFEEEMEPAMPTYGNSVAFTVALIKPDAIHKSTEIKQEIASKGFKLVREKRFVFSVAQAESFYNDHSVKPYFQNLVNFITSGPILGLVLEREGAVEELRKLLGPANSKRARDDDPQSLRARYGTDGLRNGIHGSDSVANAEREALLIFSHEIKSVWRPKHEELMLEKSLLIIQPELVNDFTMPYVLPAFVQGAESVLNLSVSNGGELESFDTRTLTADLNTSGFTVRKILYILLQKGFEILRLEQLHVSQPQAVSLFGASPEHHANNIANLISGSSIVLVLQGHHGVERLKTVVGPVCPNEGRESYPESLRAIYGIDDIRNGIYISDTIDQAHREIDIFFPYIVKQGSLSHLSGRLEQTVALIKPDVVLAGKVDEALERIIAEGFKILRKSQIELSADQVSKFYNEHLQKTFFPDLISFMTSGPVVALQLECDDAVSKWRKFIGPADVEKAKETAPNSFRALFGTDLIHNSAYGSDSVVRAEQDYNFLFVSLLEETGSRQTQTAEPASPINSNDKEPVKSTVKVAQGSKSALSPSSKLSLNPSLGSRAGMVGSKTRVDQNSSQAKLAPKVGSAKLTDSKTGFNKPANKSASKVSLSKTPAKSTAASKASISSKASAK